jgi:hypothetical protein
MNRPAVENAISFSPGVAGELLWADDQTVSFLPRSRFPISTTLTLRIDQAARSWLGRPLPGVTVSQFTTLARPFVLASAPALEAQFIYVPDHVSITFSREMDRRALLEGLTMEPVPQNLETDFKENTLTLRGFFRPRTRYQISIPPTAPDAAYGIALGRDYLWSFIVATQYPNFSILNRDRVMRLASDQPLRIPTQFTNVSRLDVTVYPISKQEFDANADAPFETWYEFQPSSPPLQETSVVTNAELDKYTRRDLTLDPLGAGTYYLRVAAPEGMSDTQLLLVE